MNAIALPLLLLLSDPAPDQRPRPEPATTLHALFREAWEFRLREDPLLATAVGDPRGADRLPSVKPADLERRAMATRDYLARLKKIDPAHLARQDRISYHMFARELGDDLAEHEFGAYRLPLTADWGFHIGIAQLPSQVPLATTRDYENYLARLRAVPAYFADHIALLREGLRTGFTLPRVVLSGYDGTIRAQVVEDPEKSVFMRPFQSFPIGVPETDRPRFREAGRAAITEAVVPAYRAFLDFMVREYLPEARQTLGASELPRGREYYAHRVKSFTTLEVTPREVHEIGVREVAPQVADIFRT